MGSKLRPLYDKLYIKVETVLLAAEYRSAAKKRASTVPALPTLNEDYKAAVRPYWKQFRVPIPKKYNFRLFGNPDKGLGEHVDPRYIPDDLWFGRVVPHYNNLIFAKALQDKCLHNLLFPGIRRPVTVVKRIAGVFYDDDLHLLTEAQAAAAFRGHGRVIVKPSVSTGQGHGIRFYDSDAMTDNEIAAVFRQYGDNFIAQEKMLQHPDLAALNPGSLNTVRILTFLHGGEVHMLSSILRIGGADSEIDNVSQGGYQCTVRPDGTLEDRAITKRGGAWVTVTENAEGRRFGDMKVPSFDRVQEAVRREASRMAHFPILGWDIAVDPDGSPVLVEYNVIPGQNQGTGGPTFGDLTDEVLTEVFGHRP